MRSASGYRPDSSESHSRARAHLTPSGPTAPSVRGRLVSEVGCEDGVACRGACLPLRSRCSPSALRPPPTHASTGAGAAPGGPAPTGCSVASCTPVSSFRTAEVSYVGEVARGALRAAGSFRAPGAPRADACTVGCAVAGGHFALTWPAHLRRTAGPVARAGTEGPRRLNRKTAPVGGHPLRVGFRPLPHTTRTRATSLLVGEEFVGPNINAVNLPESGLRTR